MESGNCFSVRSEDGKYRQVLNFGHENFEELLKRKVISYPVEILPLSEGHCLMADHRIPKEWYDKGFCSICTPRNLLPPQQKLERLLDLKSGRRKETEIDFGDGSKGVLVSHESKMPSGYIYAPWTVSTSVKADSVPMSILSRAASFLRRLLGIKHKLSAKYSNKPINPEFYGKLYLSDLNGATNVADRTSGGNKKNNAILY